MVVSWAFNEGRDTPDCFDLEWRERDGPPVKPATRNGFGQFVTQKMVARSLNATVDVDLAPDGLRWSVKMPTSEARREP